MRTILGVMAAMAALGGAATADPVTGKEARKLVFSPKGAEVEVLDVEFLTDQDRAILQQVGQQQSYYAAIAASPSEGLMSNSLIAAAKYHDVDTAAAKAIEGCNERRNDGSDSCVVVAYVRPKAWEARDLQLSVDATNGLRKEYRKGKGPKALAIAPSTGEWAIAKGDDATEAALADCAAGSGATDCAVVVAD
ncbi:hypothetical protein ACMU_17250 [Actibacterium mucosum KCTC 23349]|uniref:5-aminolevulic acid synthase n=1 Tax=Actibacterium mucosum KCTC 23349 TaxID=1454373 RepID=A0A037ZI38_9RHOB|nr:hypothetical protein [Actibacterium mucosum]KAJ54455.1 hypothetical protein ACMU_17250 [Actibacterium mucosum KCTC 23349]